MSTDDPSEQQALSPVAGIVDRQFEIQEQSDALMEWFKAHPNAHPDERKAKWRTFAALQDEYFALERRYWARKMDALKVRRNEMVRVGEVIPEVLDVLKKDS